MRYHTCKETWAQYRISSQHSETPAEKFDTKDGKWTPCEVWANKDLEFSVAFRELDSCWGK